MRHFGIYSDSSELEQAYQNGDIINPYVALVNGHLDYDTQQPCHLGEWSDNGQGTYTFHINNTGDTAWTNGVNIGQLMGVYFNGGQLDMNVRLVSPLSEPNYWTLTFEGSDPSESPNNQFNEGSPDSWTSDVMSEASYSNSTITVNWDGVDTFQLQACQDYPLSMHTINPECSE